MDIIELVIVFIFLIIFSIFSYKLKLLDLEGILIANAVGLAAFYGPKPLLYFSTVVIFFIFGEIASNYPKKKHEKRDIWNVVGNSLPALVALSLILIYPEHVFIFELAFFGAISAALADTLSSEIGYYSKSKPRFITTLKEVPRGTDGGITLVGELAGLFGGLIIAIIYFYYFQNVLGLFSFEYNLLIALVIVGAGLVGTNIDSLFGALFETKKLLDNTQVNLIGSSAGAIFAFIIGLILVL